MDISGHLYGGAPVLRKLKLGATVASAGVVIIDSAVVGSVGPATTTDAADALGLGLDTGTYTTTQSATMIEGLVTVNVRGDAILRALMSGGATEGTQLTRLLNTVAETAGTVITDTDVGTADMTSGTVWALAGSNTAQSRVITTHSSGTSFTVTVPFPNDIVVDDEFLFCPYSLAGTGAGANDGCSAVQGTTLFTQANAAIASGTGMVCSIFDLELNGRTDSFVQFILADQIHKVDTV